MRGDATGTLTTSNTRFSRKFAERARFGENWPWGSKINKLFAKLVSRPRTPAENTARPTRQGGMRTEEPFGASQCRGNVMLGDFGENWGVHIRKPAVGPR